MGAGDIRSYAIPAATSVPALTTQWTEATINPLGAGIAATFQVTTIPVSSILGIWNFLLSIYVDIPGAGGGGVVNLVSDLQYIFPTGTLLTAAQRNITLMQWVDWAQSSDDSNERVHNIRIVNNDTSPHAITLRYKAYTISGVSGAQT